MLRPLTAGCIALVLAQGKPPPIGRVEFFGYGGLEPSTLRSALPFKIGDPVPDDTVALRESIRRATGRTPTDYAPVCCDARGNQVVYLGFGGSTAFRYLTAPKGKDRLPQEATDLYEATMAALDAAVRRGASGEDQSQGYSLGMDPALRALQMAMRDFAIANEGSIQKVLRNSADAEQRGIAATLLGYARQSRAQITGLLRAVHDPSEDVRNNATRALGVLAASSPENARHIPYEPFVAMLRSGKWTDRNKAALVLSTLTASREPKLLAALRRRALPDLVEMARWETGHATMYRVILGRVAGIPDDRLFPLAINGPVEEIVRAARG